MSQTDTDEGAQTIDDRVVLLPKISGLRTPANSNISDEMGQQRSFLQHNSSLVSDMQEVENAGTEKTNDSTGFEEQQPEEWDSTGTRAMFARIWQNKHVEQETSNQENSPCAQSNRGVSIGANRKSRRDREILGETECDDEGSPSKKNKVNHDGDGSSEPLGISPIPQNVASESARKREANAKA